MMRIEADFILSKQYIRLMDLAILGFILTFVVSLTVLLKSSDFFVDASEKIGLSLGISPFVIGVTIVAFGTSLPELASSVIAVLAGDSTIVTGNVIGSNVANICLVLGLVAIVAKNLDMDASVLDVDVPVLVGSSIVFWAMVQDGEVTFWEGFLLVAMLVIFLLSSFFSRSAEKAEKVSAGWKVYALLLISAVGVYAGARYTVESIQGLSLAFGVPSSVIAASVVALGTSLPEIIVSVAAARKGNASMAVGNVVGSNIFNVFGVMGIPAMIDTIAIPPAEVSFSLPYMIGLSILFGFFASSNNVSRWEGVMLVGMYVIFLIQLF